MKLFRRILIGLGLSLGALIVLLVGSVVVDGWMGGRRLDALTNTRIPNAAGPEIRAYVARPSTPGPHPAVIMIHEFWGIRAELQGKAEALAQEGYLVVAPDMFRGRTSQWLPSAIYHVISTPSTQINSDLDAVFAWLTTQADVQANRIGILGFCFGGRTSLGYSLANNQLAATVILYGEPTTDPEQLKSLPGPVLGIFGGADSSIPLTAVRAFEAGLNQAGIPNEITVYEGQPHAFVTSMEAIRQGGAPGEAWAQVLGFLRKYLQGEETQQRPAAPISADYSTDWGYLIRLAYEHALGQGAHGH